MNDVDATVISFFVGMILGGIISLVIASNHSIPNSELIKRDILEYNSTTGELQYTKEYKYDKGRSDQQD